MVDIDRGDISARYARIYVGTAGSEASTLLGMQVRDTPVQIVVSRRDERYYHDQGNLPFFIDNSVENVEVSGGLWQLEVDVLKNILGYTENGLSLSLSASTTWNEHSIKIVGLKSNGQAFTFRSKYAKPIGDVTFEFSANTPVQIPLSFALLAPETSTAPEYELFFGSGSDAVTLSTGSLTRVAAAGFHTITSESGTTDTLTTITGSSLTNGEVLILAPTAGHDITLTHASDTLELAGAADWLMDNDNDWIKLQYGSSSTEWVEVGRYDHPSA